MIWKPELSGALAMAAALALVAGAGARFIPGSSAAGPLARILDSLAPWLLAGALMLALGATALGLCRLGAGLMAAALVALAGLGALHLRQSLPALPGQTPDLRILFFNACIENELPAETIVRAALGPDPDIIIFAEAEAIAAALPLLQARYDFVSPCQPGACQIVLAARSRPRRFWTMSLNPAWPDRYAVAEIETAGGKRVFLAGLQLLKPWMSGLADTELERLTAQLGWLPGPAVAIGDFNAAPWSRTLSLIHRDTGMATARLPRATWPVAAGRFGVPIDQVLVGGGARLVRLSPFGEDLGSNHRGLLAEITLP
ncbi:endonuclease/exonuclease/phosphatase family protein [Rhodovulum sp. YEN HP10]|uniref:endonuclease/exonuclease/phosphatase family protein n=1 Tax=Rhodovulum sp. HP10 TaxID=3387397 RepID=UPI0039DF3D06